MEIIYKKLTELKPYKNNPRKNDDAVEYVANSIKEFGFKVPVIITADGEIVAGHTRYKASKKLGLKQIPCIVADDLSEEQIKAFRLADNKVGEIASWDMTLLDDEIGGINFDMEQFGFTEWDVLDENEPTERKEYKLKDGVYQLIIECENEEDMSQKYEMLKEMGIKCKTSTL